MKWSAGGERQVRWVAMKRRLRAGSLAAALFAVPFGAVTFGAPRTALADLSQGEALGVAAGELDGVEKDLPTAIASASKAGIALRSADQMIADGELLFRLRDYPRAILVFSQIIERYPNEKASWAEAVYRDGEALYASRDFLSARTNQAVGFVLAEHGNGVSTMELADC